MNAIQSGIIGLAVGDALGTPAEFRSRLDLDKHPITGMVGGGVHGMPAGTWSDDTSLTLALADSLATGKLDYNGIMGRFAAWLEEGAYTPDGKTFDVGITTRQAIRRYQDGIPALECGGRGEKDNGNGSLMRILPLAFYVRSRYGRVVSIEGVEAVHKVSSLTHAHPRSQAACTIYCAIADHILDGEEIAPAIGGALEEVAGFYSGKRPYRDELEHFGCMAMAGIGFGKGAAAFRHTPREEIRSGGYVVETLDAALWCLLNYEGYRDTVLAAVNLGGDADTTAAVCGGLAGLYYQGQEQNAALSSRGIPHAWMEGLRGYPSLVALCNRLKDSLC